MLGRLAIVVCALSAVLTSVETASAAPYIFTPLPPVSPDTASYGIAVSQVGGLPAIAGSDNAITNMNRGYPVIWNGASTGTDVVANIPGAVYGKPWAIDASGDVVGHGCLSTGAKEAYYLPSGGTSATILPQTGNNTWVVAYGLNNSGQVVGVDSASDGYTGQAVVWTKTGGVWGESNLPSLATGAYSAAYAINSSGVVAGDSNTAVGVQIPDATTWSYNSSTSTWVATDKISNHSNWNATTNPKGCYGQSTALAINATGTVVGWAYPYDPIVGGANPDAIAIETDGTIVNLGGGSGPNQANAINDSGVIVGEVNLHAVLWDSNYQMYDLNSLYASIIPAGWTLQSAMGIDDAGDIVGYASSPSFPEEGFRLSPATPGDANLDGKVDINDLTVVLAHYGQTGMAWSQGEFTGDGTVDINDLTIVLAHYGQSDGAAAGPVAAVPEPASLLLLAAGALGLLGYASRKQR